VLLAVVRFLVVLFLVRLGLRMFAASRQQRAPDGSGQDLVRDRVCNTFVPRDRALQGLVGGRTEHFCSAECRDRASATLDSRPGAVQSHARNSGTTARDAAREAAWVKRWG
jgi:hypothetical protein